MIDDIGDCKINSNIFYTITKTGTYSIHYHCKSLNCEKITDAVKQITSSLKIK